MDSTDKYIGMLLDSRYEIIEKIGTGGMAVVYKARCHRLNRLVAIKILKEELAGDEDFRRRFHTESQAVAMLSHPNIVAIYDVSHSDNLDYIVMELIDGITLKQYINRKGLLGWKESLHFVTQIIKALGHAHSKGIIHRDIKPHNIMILKDGSVKVADFGIARLISGQNTLTREALGSVHYISPEQAKGGHVDARSDLYSVGVVLYEMLTSRLPFVGDSAVSIAIQHISAIPLMPRDINPDIPEGLEDITMHAMEADVNLRYVSADEMLLDLEDFRKNPAVTFDYVHGTAGAPKDLSASTKQVPIVTAKRAEAAQAISARAVRAAKKPEMTRRDYREVNRRASRTSMLIGVLGVLVFLVVAFMFMWNNYLKIWLSPEEKTIVIDQLIGKQYDEVIKNNELLAIYSFLPPTQQYSDDFDEGIIIDQSPEANRTQKVPVDGSKILINLTVSMGRKQLPSMPDLVGMEYGVAINKLRELDASIDVRREIEESADVEVNMVIRTEPKENELLSEGMTVYVYYSVGPKVETVVIPDFVGLDIEIAKKQIDDLKLDMDLPEYIPHDEPKDTVVFQTPQSGKVLPEGTVIRLQLSEGPAEESPPPTDEDPTESPGDTTDVPTPSDSPSVTDEPPTTPSDPSTDLPSATPSPPPELGL